MDSREQGRWPRESEAPRYHHIWQVLPSPFSFSLLRTPSWEEQESLPLAWERETRARDGNHCPGHRAKQQAGQARTRLGPQPRLLLSPLKHLCTFQVKCESGTVRLLSTTQQLRSLVVNIKVQKVESHTHDKHCSLRLTTEITFKVAYFFYTETKTSRCSSRHASCADRGGGGWGSGSIVAGHRTCCHFLTLLRRRWGLGAGTPLRNLLVRQKWGLAFTT